MTSFSLRFFLEGISKCHGWGQFEFCKFSKKEGSDFSHKKGGVGEIGGCFKKGGITYFHTN